MHVLAPARRRDFFLAASTLALLALAPGVAPAAQPATPTSESARSVERFVVAKGPLGCTTTDVTIRDEVRGKDLELRVRIPTGDGKPAAAPLEGWPLIVFSHGAGGSRDAFPDLLEFCASHGYASIAMTHSDSIKLKRREAAGGGGGGGGGGGLRELATPEAREQLRNSVNLGERVGDCKLVVDRLSDISAAVAKVGGPAFAIDLHRLAIAGHSAGAFTTQLVAGVKARGRGIGERGLGLTSIGDDRFRAAIIISGQGTTSRVLSTDSWSDIKIPILVIGGSLDSSPANMGRETPESRRHSFEFSRGVAKGGPPAYLIYIEGATHSAYAGKATAALLGENGVTDVRQIQDAVASASMLFLDAHLRASAAALDALAADRLRDAIPGKVTFGRK